MSVHVLIDCGAEPYWDKYYSLCIGDQESLASFEWIVQTPVLLCADWFHRTQLKQ